MSDERCESTSEIIVKVRCEREKGHGGAHTAKLGNIAGDPYDYVVSWWPAPKPEGGDE